MTLELNIAEKVPLCILLGASPVALLLTLVSRTSLGSGQAPFVRCQHKHFRADSGNDEEISECFQGRY